MTGGGRGGIALVQRGKIQAPAGFSAAGRRATSSASVLGRKSPMQKPGVAHANKQSSGTKLALEVP
jgi:hypothetical protein